MVTRPKKTVPVKSGTRSVRAVLSEPTTWAGVLLGISALYTGGLGVLTDPVVLGQIGAGISLIFAREG